MVKYELILNELKKLYIEDNFYFKPVKPKLSDIELVAINLVAEYRGIHSEYQLFRDLKYTELAISNEKVSEVIERQRNSSKYVKKR